MCVESVPLSLLVLGSLTRAGFSPLRLLLRRGLCVYVCMYIHLFCQGGDAAGAGAGAGAGGGVGNVDDDEPFEADKEYRATKTWSVEELQLLWDLKTKDREFDVCLSFCLLPLVG